MVNSYFVQLLFSQRDMLLNYEVRQKEQIRIEKNIDSYDAHGSRDRFVWFESIDGKSIIFNLRYLQAIRYLWDPVSAPPDLTRYEGPVEIYLNGRSKPLETYVGAPETLYACYTELECGAGVTAFPGYEDEDGETIQLNPTETVLIQAPAYILSEGGEVIEMELEERP